MPPRTVRRDISPPAGVTPNVLRPVSDTFVVMTSAPCPRCDGNGEVRLFKVTGTGERLRICDECEAAWPSNGPLDAEHMHKLADFGVLDNWGLLQPLES